MAIVEATKPFLMVSTITIIVADLLLDILVWYKRNAASCLLYVELVNILNHGLVPYDYG